MAERFHFQQVDSTNNYASELLVEKTSVVVSADYQTGGRGRNNKNWLGAYGENIYYSYGLKHTNKIFNNLTSIQSISCLAVMNTLEKLSKQNIFKIKYPNDIYALCKDDIYRKISGCLIEHKFSGSVCSYSIIGIGINNQQTKFDTGEYEEILSNTTSLALLGINLENDKIIDTLTKEIEFLLIQSEDKIYRQWAERINLRDKIILVVGIAYKWKFKELLADGRLVLFNDKEEIIIDNGDSIRYEL